MKEIDNQTDNETHLVDTHEEFVNEQCENSKTGFVEHIENTNFYCVDSLEEKLNKLNIKKIDTIDDLKKIIDFTIKDGRPEPVIVADGLSMIMMDNKNYNETYLIDEFEKFVNEQCNKNEDVNKKRFAEYIENTNFYYVDSLELKSFIRRMGEIVPIQNEEYLEKNVLVPTIIIMDKSSDDIGILKEGLISVLDESDFFDAYQYITKER